MATSTVVDVEYSVGHELNQLGPSKADGPSSHNEPLSEPADRSAGRSLNSQTDIGQQDEYPTGANLWLILLSVSGVLVLTSIDMNIVATAVPSITDHFHTVTDVGWYSSAFRLCLCAFQFMFGKAYILFSVKYLFLIANIISIVGSLFCGTATSSNMLIMGRAVAGLGSAGIFSGCFVILVQSLPLHRRPLFVGIMGGIEGIATLSAPLLGGVLTQSLGWRWCFYINPPLGVVTLLLTMWCYSDKPKSAEVDQMTFTQKILQLDLVSNLLFIPALTSLFIALSWAGTKYPWSSGQVIGPLIVFVFLLAGFIYNQFRRGDTAALPPRIIKRRTVIAGFIFIMCTNSTANVLEYYLPTYYQTVRGYSPAKSGYLMFPIIVGATIGSLIHGTGTSTFGHYGPFMLFASVIMPIAAGLVTTFEVDTSMVKLIMYTALCGLAYGIGFSGPQNAVQTVLPADEIPLGMSIMLFAQSFGPAVTIAIAQVIFTNQLWTNLSGFVEGLTRGEMEKSGLSEIVSSVPSGEARQVLEGIDKSISQTWYLVVGLACATMVGSLLIEWRSVKSKRA
ncbi:hypothetical protein V2G26_011931 [Clonostachys chloroleuca]|uniref:Major facilitator superfamily (MFS) profile domain-containing protein n=1 Tax=Clonostachys chloroleuca TaxID=1926264 RepID=A0AA35PZY1_9HYPO|nr:unnamed protein product [Clonostachys chloroleuca]